MSDEEIDQMVELSGAANVKSGLQSVAQGSALGLSDARMQQIYAT